jgi:glycosyltransferase involved in cell wall biosynthesis
MKKKILIADTAPLYPPLWGGPKRIWSIYNNFSQELFDFIYVGVNFNLAKDLKYNFKRIRHNFKEITCGLPLHYYPWHAMEKMLFKNTSVDLFIYLYMHTDWHFKYILNSFKADVLICSHPWAALSLKKNKGQLFIYDSHNCEYLLMNQILRKHWLKKVVLKQVKKIESYVCNKSDLILACSEDEKKDFISLYRINAEKIIIVPNGTNTRKKVEQAAKESCRRNISIGSEDRVIVFVGAYYKPNNDAARFIIEKIAPRLRKFKFIIIGSCSDAFDKGLLPSNIRLLGRVSEEQLDAVLSASDIAINPMFNGSGVNIKMLDYMSYGLPIVTTQVGARGIEASGKAPFIVSTIDKFIDNIDMLSCDSVLHKQMSEAGLGLSSGQYDWKKISSRLQDIISERLNQGGC